MDLLNPKAAISDALAAVGDDISPEDLAKLAALVQRIEAAATVYCDKVASGAIGGAGHSFAGASVFITGIKEGVSMIQAVVAAGQDVSAADYAILLALVVRIESAATTYCLNGGGSGGAGTVEAAEAGEVPAFVNEFDDLVAGEFKTFLDLSNKVGDAAAAAAPMFEKSFQLTRDLLCMVGASKKPAGWPGAMPDNITAIIQEVGGMMGEMGNLPGGREISKAVAEGSQALSWVVMEPLPAPHVKDMGEAMWFWGQKVVVANKGKNQGPSGAKNRAPALCDAHS